MNYGQAVCGSALATAEARAFFESKKKRYPQNLLLQLVMECQE